MTVQQKMEDAVRHHQAGRLKEAEEIYRQVLVENPAQPDALHLLGVIAIQVGRYDTAAELIQWAIAINPLDADYHNHLGHALREIGKFAPAIAACRRAIQLRPDFANAHNNLGNALCGNKEYDAAIAAYHEALRLAPDFAEAYSNLGNALFLDGRIDEAIAAYREAIRLNPNFPDAHCNLGNVLCARGHLDEAIAACREAIRIKPDYAQAYNNLGNVWRDKRRFEEAVGVYRRALQIKPDFAEAHYNLGVVLFESGNLDDSVASYQRAIQIDPKYVMAFSGIGTAFKEKGRLDEALAAYRQARDLKPSFAAAYSNLAYAVNFHQDFTPEMVLREARNWADQFEQPLSAEIKPHGNDRSPERRLRVGYVSPDFRRSAVARFLMTLLKHHDPEKVEIYCYSGVKNPDEMTRRFQNLGYVFRHVAGISDRQLAEQIRADQIDILMDLALHLADNRLLTFARKPAPVQVTWLGYVGTTGLSNIDYRLTDPFLDPPGVGDEFYSEKSIRLPHCFWCYEPDESSPGESVLPATERGHVTFGSLNNFAKMTPPALDVWANILSAVPDSRLILSSRQGDHRAKTLERFSRSGVDPNRIEFVGTLPVLEYLEQYNRIDIALDPFPHCGGTTTCDALWMGVPTVTLRGRTAVGRAGASILSNVGLLDWIAQSPDQYVAIASERARDLGKLKELRSSLRKRMKESPLMDGVEFAAGVEAAYRTLWRNWCSTEGERISVSKTHSPSGRGSTNQ